MAAVVGKARQMGVQLAGPLEEAHGAQPTDGGDLDTDVVLAILQFANVETLLTVGATCRQWRELAKDALLWEKLYKVCVLVFFMSWLWPAVDRTELCSFQAGSAAA